MLPFFRKICPSKNKVISKALSNDAHRLNRRKFLVNAQVTAMISFLEAFGAVGYIIIVWFSVRTSYTTLIEVLCLYLILLPYSFLMNTSHNKNRIIEHGWKNVFKNLIGRTNQSMVSNDNIPTESDNIKKRENEPEKAPDYEVEKKIFTTASSSNNSGGNTNVHISKLHGLFGEVPSTSTGQTTTNRKISASITLDVNELPQVDDKLFIAQRLISVMISHINDEEHYIVYFKQLVEYEDGCKKGNIPSAFELETGLLSCCKSNFEIQRENAKYKGKRSKPTTRHSTTIKKCKTVCYVQDMDETDNKKINFLGEKEDRIVIRKGILDQIQSCYKTDETYDSFIEQLINIEESFVQ